MQGKNKDEASKLLMKHLEGRSFDFFHDAFTEDGQFY